MVEASSGEASLTFESYMSRFEGSNVYFSKLMDFASSGRLSMEIRGKAINMAISRAKALKKIA